MDTIYLISLIVGGFFVLLSIFGGAEHDVDHDADFDMDADFDVGADFDHDFDVDHDISFDGDIGTSVGFVDLLSIRALFLFAAFFGLTGSVLTWTGGAEPFTAVLSTLTGLVVGLGGNYAIKKFAYEQVSSEVTPSNMRGKTGKVLLPFGADDRGKIQIEAKGQRLHLTARSFENSEDTFEAGDEIVVVRIDGRVAEVVKPT